MAGEGGSAPEGVIEVYLSADGRYEGVNELALEVLGYTIDEVLALPPGTLSGVGPAAVAELWGLIRSGEATLPPDRPGELVTKDGTVLATTFLGLSQDRPNGGYTGRSLLVSRHRIDVGRPMALHHVLARWRSAERDLDALPEDDPRRPDAERDVADLKRLYRQESERLSTDGANLATAVFGRRRGR